MVSCCASFLAVELHKRSALRNAVQWYSGHRHTDLDCRIVSKKDFETSFLGQENLVV